MRRLAVILLCLLCSGQLFAQQRNKQQIDKLHHAYNYLQNNYVDELDLAPLVDEALHATLRELDPHSTYLTREEMSDLRIRLRGEFAGVGIKYIVHNDTIVVRGIIPNSPAAHADIRPNDRITAINNTSALGISTDSVATLLRGAPRTSVAIDIVRRDEPKPLSITLQRSTIESSAISSTFRIGDVGYVAVSHFSKPVTSEFIAAYRSLGDIKGLIVDLRDNGGGAISSAIDLTGLFLPHKGDVILSTEGRSRTVVYDKRRDGLFPDIPLVVLINENSASASEIFAGAIQDHDRGVVIGRTSYGKGLVQRVVDFKDGSGMCLTIARYKTPSGRIIQRPYDMGHGEEYRHDSLRYRHADSISMTDRPRYTTLKSGRTVYGGGGITPDIYISADTATLSDDLAKVYSRAVFDHVAVDILDRVAVAEIVATYPTVEAFNDGYELSDEAVEHFYKCSGLMAESMTEVDRRFITTMLMAAMAEPLYGSGAHHYIYSMRFDPLAQRAFEVAADSAIIDTILR